MKIIKKIITSFFSVALMLILSGCGSSTATTYKIDLEIWGLFDDSVTYDSIIGEYKKINPYVGEIKYKKSSADTYKQDIIDAMASGQGPDIVLIGNNWLPAFENKLAPAPQYVFNNQEFSSNFVNVASTDFMSKDRIFAVPLSVDSLALFYNRGIFNATGIATPPKTWTEFNTAVRATTIFNNTGAVVRSGVAMGTAQNVNRATDVLNMLMMQSGVKLPSQSDPQARFNEGVFDAGGAQARRAGEDALSYYTNFARLVLPPNNTPNPLACWGYDMHYSIDAFVEENAAMMINYSWQIDTIKKQNPKLNFAVAPVPQFNTNAPANFANYWGYAVSKNKMERTVASSGKQDYVPMSSAKNDARIHEAWQFLKFLTIKNNGSFRLMNALTKQAKDFSISIDPALEYAKRTNKPAARYDIIELQKADPYLAPFAVGNLIAKSWYNVSPEGVENVFGQAIDAVVKGDMSAGDALKLADQKINSFNFNARN